MPFEDPRHRSIGILPIDVEQFSGRRVRTLGEGALHVRVLCADMTENTIQENAKSTFPALGDEFGKVRLVPQAGIDVEQIERIVTVGL